MNGTLNKEPKKTKQVNGDGTRCQTSNRIKGQSTVHTERSVVLNGKVPNLGTHSSSKADVNADSVPVCRSQRQQNKSGEKLKRVLCGSKFKDMNNYLVQSCLNSN